MSVQKSSLLPRSSWRRSALLLSALTSTLTVLLIIFFVASLSNRNGVTTRLFSGNCKQASRLSLALHVAVNIVATGVLASSNFFMQILAAPTREEIDKAHTRHSWLEIGVQSMRNLRFLPHLHRILWVLLSVTAIPLHLIFNSIVVETKSSTNALVLLASENFIYGADKNGSLPIISSFPADKKYDRRSWKPHMPSETPISPLPPQEIADTVRDISISLQTSLESWEYMTIQDCINRYNRETILTDHRHVVMVISNMNETVQQTQGWTAAEVYVNATASAAMMNVVSPLWLVGEFGMTDIARITGEATAGPLGSPLEGFSDLYLGQETVDTISLDLVPTTAGRYESFSELVQDRFSTMRTHYCRSESHVTSCNVDTNNELFGIVCVFCLVKVALCIAALRLLRRRSPLITPGDAIESFIIQPDPTTNGMASASWDMFARRKEESLGSSRQMPVMPWKKSYRSALHVIPTAIWVWSYLLIGICLAVSGFFYHQAAENHYLSDSEFGDSSSNRPVLLNGKSSLIEGNNASVLALLANTPQLILSICYLVYNGLFTRLCSEYEWAAYSTKFLPLRVSDKKGQQRSTHRLQLPYCWAIPLLLTSTVLHWLFSNCIYVVLLEGHSAFLPYPSTIYSGMLYSEIAILVSLIICCVLAVIPLVVSLVIRLPGQMVVMGSCSAVISAACHCVNTAPSDSSIDGNRPNFDRLDSTDPPPQKPHKGGNEASIGVGVDDQDYATEMTALSYHQDTGTQTSLFDIAVGKLKWGVVSQIRNIESRDESQGEHLAFGSEGSNITEPVEGRFYI